MKKSPGKWIKTVLFGKKTSKSTISKNATADKKPAAVKATVVDLGGDSEPPSQFTDRGTENIELEKPPSGSCAAANALEPQNDIVAAPPLSDNEMSMQEEAATKAQAAFRGYLARRAFRALKGIIRLQALIRGHLVRRQAAATLRCMQSIVKLQALARGQKDAKVDTGANSFYLLATNSFVRKLLVSLPNVSPLSLQYEQADPNSAWNWLERWSLSHFWEPPTKAKKTLNSKPQRKHGNPQTSELDSGKSKRTIRKSSSAVTNGDNVSTLETDKPKRNLRKIVSQPVESLEENPQNELERVKRNLKKVSASAAAAVSSEKPEIETDQCVKIVPISDVSEKEIVTYSDSDAIVDKSAVLEAPSETFTTDEVAEIPDIKDPPTVETQCSENGDKSEILNDELSVKEEDSSGKGNLQTRKRRSLPAKPQQQQEYPENISQNTPASLPSYMMATQSAKAKLRAQGKLGEDGVAAEAGYVRRHSLPASAANGKMASLSPRIQKPLQANGKGATKANKSLTASRDDKGLQPGWRR